MPKEADFHGLGLLFDGRRLKLAMRRWPAIAAHVPAARPLVPGVRALFGAVALGLAVELLLRQVVSGRHAAWPPFGICTRVQTSRPVTAWQTLKPGLWPRCERPGAGVVQSRRGTRCSGLQTRFPPLSCLL